MATTPQSKELIEKIAQQFARPFPRQGTSVAPRTVGREAEYPLVTSGGQALELARLWRHLLEPGDLVPKHDGSSDLIVGAAGPDYSYALEVGRATVEINTRPCADLHEIDSIHRRAVLRLTHAAALEGGRLLASGMQPLTPASSSLLAPKQRYIAMHESMGDDWLWYTVTASDQTQVSIHQEEMVLQFNLANLMAPVIIALCGNSAVYAGTAQDVCAGREAEVSRGRFAGRHGLPERPVDSLEDLVWSLSQLPFLLRRGDGTLVPESRRFIRYAQEEGASLEDFLLHEHYVWNSARLRHAYGTIEIRPACQQPWAENMAASALCLGIIESADELWRTIRSELGETFWQQMRDYRIRAIRFGLAAPEPRARLLAQLLEIVERGLRKRERGEEIYLAPLYQRLDRRQNPAQTALHNFRQEGDRGGLAGFLRTHAIVAGK